MELNGGSGDLSRSKNLDNGVYSIADNKDFPGVEAMKDSSTDRLDKNNCSNTGAISVNNLIKGGPK